ncbi:hypothetical protein [Aureimonas ureilytica]|uniref:hypothetical protein n=1 Tax=Aureimonas ureilytica TaxID=401562 RepID=UPI00036DD6AB|nr:hypothetical protein [Aureimonas ureilytica]
MSHDVDLFGDPIPPGHGRRGRPAHVPTRASRDKVLIGLALGWSNERIANGMGLSLPTLRKAYAAELKTREMARDRMDLRIVEKLFEGVNAGNVGAIKELRKVVERNDMMVAADAARFKPREAEEEKSKPLGKKEQRQANADAQTSQGRFAVPAPPRRHMQ